MDIIHVSNTATNGYILGNDNNNGTSKQLAVLTLERALAIAIDGSIIKINNGIYQPPTINYWTITKSAHLIPETPKGVILQSCSGTDIYRLFNISAGIAVTLNLEDIILDGLDYLQFGIYSSQINNLATINLTRVELNNFLFHSINQAVSSGHLFVNIKDCSLSGLNWQRGGIYMPDIAAGGLIVDGLSIDQTGRNNASGGLVYIHAVEPGIVAKVQNVSGISRVNAEAGTANFIGVSIGNIPNAIIQDSQLDIIGGGPTSSGTLFEITADATGIQDSSWGKITRCSGTNGMSFGKTAVYGSDAKSAIANNMCNYGEISYCNFVGNANSTAIHGPMLGYNMGGIIHSCTTDLCGIGGLGLVKNQITGTGRLAIPMCIGNKTIRCKSSACYQKGSTGAVHANNILITSEGYTPTFELTAWNDSDVPQIMGSNGIFANNICTGNVAPQLLAVQGTPGNAFDTTSGTVFYGSYYDRSLGLLSNKWRNGVSIVYPNIQSFNTAMADVNHPCIMDALNLDANGNFTINSPYRKAGYKFWQIGNRPIGNDGEPLPDIDISIGHRQIKDTPFHPSKLLVKI